MKRGVQSQLGFLGLILGDNDFALVDSGTLDCLTCEKQRVTSVTAAYVENLLKFFLVLPNAEPSKVARLLAGRLLRIIVFPIFLIHVLLTSRLTDERLIRFIHSFPHYVLDADC